MKWSKENLWNQIEGSINEDDTYMNRIINEVFKEDKCTVNNCAFVVTIVNMIFDMNVQTTTLNEEMIVTRMNQILGEYDEDEVLKYNIDLF